jgi:hypothetical protein
MVIYIKPGETPKPTGAKKSTLESNSLPVTFCCHPFPAGYQLTYRNVRASKNQQKSRNWEKADN